MNGIIYATTQDDAAELGRRLIGTQFTFRQIKLRCEEVARAGEPVLEIIEGVARREMLRVYDRFALSLGR
jgi:hypothetical protein